jgi:arsenate reductase (thioredoxin)
MSETGGAQIDLTLGERLDLKQAADRLQREFEGILNTETIERFMTNSLDQLMVGATITKWIPLLAERFARERLRAMVRIEARERGELIAPAVLFLCVHNAGRSQIAAGWLRRLAGEQVDIFTGGSEPAADLNQGAVAAMAEVGIDISSELPKPWADEVVRSADVIVTMGCGDACPLYPGKRYLDWEVDDPAGKTLAEIRLIRDDIGRRVRELVAELGLVVHDAAHSAGAG